MYTNLWVCIENQRTQRKGRDLNELRGPWKVKGKGERESQRETLSVGAHSKAVFPFFFDFHF